MNVKILRQKYDVTIVEYTDENGNLLRGIAPTSIVSADGIIDDDRMSLVIPDYVDWAFIFEGAIRPTDIMEIAKQFARKLYARRVWTLADMRANPQAVDAALKSAMGISVSAVIKAAEEFEHGGTNG